MNIDIHQSLNDQKKELQKQINDLNTKLSELEILPFKERVLYCLSLSITPYLITLQLSKTLLELELIPNTIINYLTIGTSLTIGIISENSMLKKFHYPSLWYNFINFKTNEEKKLKYKIEIKKLENQIKILEKAEKIEPKIFSQLPPQILTNNKIKHLKSILKEKIQHLNILSTKEILKEKFQTERQDTKTTLFQRNFQSLIYSLLSTIIFNLPNLYAQETLSCLSQTTIMAPLLLSYLTIYSYQTIRFKENLKLFRKFNSELKTNSLPEIEDYQAEKNIEKEQEEIINNILQINSEINTEKLKLLIPIYFINQQYNPPLKQIIDYEIPPTPSEPSPIFPLTKSKKKTPTNHHNN